MKKIVMYEKNRMMIELYVSSKRKRIGDTHYGKTPNKARKKKNDSAGASCFFSPQEDIDCNSMQYIESDSVERVTCEENRTHWVYHGERHYANLRNFCDICTEKLRVDIVFSNRRTTGEDVEWVGNVIMLNRLKRSYHRWVNHLSCPSMRE